jgi:hypothetical protein
MGRMAPHWHFWFAFLLLSASVSSLGEQAALLTTELASERVTVAQGGYFPRMLLLRDGEILLTCKTGAPHVGKASRASLLRSRDGGRTWSAPVTVFDYPDALDSTDALGELRDGTLLFAAFSSTWAGTDPRPDYATDKEYRTDTYVIRSVDKGVTWEKPIKVNTAPYTWAAPFGRIVSLPDGSILLSCYGGYPPVSDEHSPARKESERGTFCFLLRSRDGGRNWGDLSLIARHYNETTLLRLPNNKLLAVMRSADEDKHLASCSSHDQGRTWSAPKQITSRSEHPGDLLMLADGRVLLTFGVRHKPFGVQAMLSKDNGESWDSKRRFVLALDGDHGDIGYPISVQRGDGRIVTAYYIVYGPYDPFGIKGVAPKSAYTKAVIWELPRD